ncbi:hypothetical protein BK141_23940 [Paenibacillus sp. FSL R5-0765]|nr:hypothetical protein BK141_23940 [Paenibacillus sp. FSL R5-0765]
MVQIRMFLKEVDSLGLTNAQLNLNKSYQKFFKRLAAGFPKWKSHKNSVQSYTTNNQNGTIAIVDGRYFKLLKMDPVRIKLHRQPRGINKSATISKAALGKYYFTILFETDVQLKDLGLTHFAVLSELTKIQNPKHQAKTTARLAKPQRKLSHRAQVAKKHGLPCRRQLQLPEAAHLRRQVMKK